MTDMMYEDQYDKLFPVINNAGAVQVRGNISCSEELLYDIKTAYLKYIIELDTDIPALSQIMDYLEEKLEDKVFDYARAQYGETEGFWNDDEFREAALLEAEEVIYQIEEYSMYEARIRYVLNMLRCTYLDDDLNYPGYGEIINDAQLGLFQEPRLARR